MKSLREIIDLIPFSIPNKQKGLLRLEISCSPDCLYFGGGNRISTGGGPVGQR
jgi:hypothetical protein